MEKCKVILARPACAIRTLLTKVNELVEHANLNLDAAKNAQQAAEAAAQAAGSAADTATLRDELLAKFGQVAYYPTAEGVAISIDDAARKPLDGLSVFGQTTQATKPTMDAPVGLENVGASGVIAVNLNGDAITVDTTNGLPGVPVTSGGNYKDADGRQWISDEIDLARGVYVQRIQRVRLTSTSHAWVAASTAKRYNINTPRPAPMAGVCPMSTHFVGYTNVYTTPGSLANNAGTQFVFSTNIDTMAAWKSWLDDNEVWVYYALSTPVETPLDADTLAAFEGLRTVYGANTLDAEGAFLRVSYRADNNLYFEEVRE